MDAEGIKKQVNNAQLTVLLEFLKEHPDLARGLTRARRGKFLTLRSWHLCAKKLNAVKDGAVKDAKGWSKYWCDWKYRVCRRALELKAAKDTNRHPPEGMLPLSSMEENILSIMGENATNELFIKTDSLGEEDADEDCNNYIDHEDKSQKNNGGNYSSKRPRTQLKAVNSKDHLSGVGDKAGSNTPHRKHVEGHQTYREDEASAFLRLEREKLEINRQMAESMQTIRSDISRIADVMSHIKDIIANNRIRL